jgi:CH-like domain in sperm protein
VIAHYFPKLVELHNYAAANSVSQKMYNWATLIHKVLRRLSYQMSPPEIDAVVQGKPGKLS